MQHTSYSYPHRNGMLLDAVLLRYKLIISGKTGKMTSSQEEVGEVRGQKEEFSIVELSCTCFMHVCLKDKITKRSSIILEEAPGFLRNASCLASQTSLSLVTCEATFFSYGLLLRTFASFFSSFCPKDTCDAFTFPELLPKFFFFFFWLYRPKSTCFS